MGKCHITRFAGPPTTAPIESGHHWVDTLNKQEYASVGTDSVSDWILQDDPGAVAAAAISAHEAATDPHPQYQTAPEVDTAIQVLEGTIAAEQATQDAATVAAAALGTAAQLSANNAQATADLAQTNLDDHEADLANPHATNLLGLTDVITPSYTGGNKFYTLMTNAAGTGVELFELFERTATRLDPLLHQATTFATYLTMTVDIPVTGDYLFMMTYSFSINSTTVNFEAHLEKDGDFFLINHIEFQDAAGAGQVVANTTGGTTNTGTDQMQTPTGIHKFVGLTAGTHTFNLEYRGQTANQEATIYNAQMYLKRLVE